MLASINILAIMEAQSLTGPARNLIEFAIESRSLAPPLPQVRLTLATYRRPGDPSTDGFLSAAAQAGIPCHIIRENNALDWSKVAALRRLTALHDPDIVQSHNVKSNFMVRLSGLAKRYPWIAWHHGYTAPTRTQQIYNAFDRWSLRAAQRVITVTGAFLPELERAGVTREKVIIIPNAIRGDWASSIERDDALRQRAALIPAGALLVLAVGRLSKEKAHADLIQALAFLAKRPGIPPVHLLLAGEGYERQNLAKLAARCGVPVHFAGHISDVRPFYAMADMFVLPSHSEGSPNVLLEAMAIGLPIVATTAGGIPDIVEHGRQALLVSPGQPQQLAEAIHSLCNDPGQAKALSSSAQRRIAEKYAPSARAKSLAEWYSEFLRSARRS